MGTYVSFRFVVRKIKAQSSHKFTVAGDTSNKDTVAPTLVRAHA